MARPFIAIDDFLIRVSAHIVAFFNEWLGVSLSVLVKAMAVVYFLLEAWISKNITDYFWAIAGATYMYFLFWRGTSNTVPAFALIGRLFFLAQTFLWLCASLITRTDIAFTAASFLWTAHAYFCHADDDENGRRRKLNQALNSLSELMNGSRHPAPAVGASR